MECKAKSKRSQKPCRRVAMTGKQVCYNHGGKSLAGPLSPSYKDGTYSRYLPARFSELFKALEGRDLLDLTEDIKLLHTRLMDVAKRVDSGESGERWKEASKAYDEARKAQSEGDPQKMAAELNTLGQILKLGLSDWDAWEKIEELVVKKTKVVESQRKRAVEAHEMLAAQDARAMMRAITEGLKRAVEENVTDDQIKRKIFVAASSEFARLVNPGRVELVSTADN